MKKNEFMIFRTRWYIFFSLCLSLNRKGGGREKGRGRGEGKVEGGKGEGSGGGKKKIREVLERVPFLPPHPHPHPRTEYLCCVALAALNFLTQTRLPSNFQWSDQSVSTPQVLGSKVCTTPLPGVHPWAELCVQEPESSGKFIPRAPDSDSAFLSLNSTVCVDCLGSGSLYLQDVLAAKELKLD